VSRPAQLRREAEAPASTTSAGSEGAAFGWLSGGLAVAAGGYLLGVSPAWAVPEPLYAELGGPLLWVARQGWWLGLGLVGLGALTLLEALRPGAGWTRGRTLVNLACLAGVTLAVASQGQSLSLVPLREAPNRSSTSPSPQPTDPAPALPNEPAPPLEPVDELLHRFDARNGPKNLGVVDALIRHGEGAVPALEAYVLEPGSPGRAYAVYALTQLLKRHGAPASGLQALLACLDASVPAEVRARAATGLTVLADPRTVGEIVDRFQGESELREALYAISGQRFRDPVQARSWWATHRDGFPAQLQGTAGERAPLPRPVETTEDRIAALLALLRDSDDEQINAEVVGELRRLGEAAIPGLIDLAERRVDGSGWAAHALARVLQDLPTKDRPRGALEVLVACVSADADYVLQSRALEGLVELADPRTVEALLVHLDHPRPAVRFLCRSHCERLTGEAFPSRAAGEAWWREHGARLGPQVGVAR